MHGSSPHSTNWSSCIVFTPLPQKYADDFRPQKEALQNEFSDMRKELMNDIQESESMVITLLRLTRSSRKFQLG